MTYGAATVAAVGGFAAPTVAQSAEAPHDEIERAIHAEVNRRRESRGLAPLTYNADIAAAARAYSRRMATEGFFSHTPPGADGFAAHYRDDGVDCDRLGENILYRTRRADSPAAVATNVVDQWMGSAGHRENILGDWRSEGVGVAVTDDGVLYVTQGFGSCPGTTDASAGGNASTTTPSDTETPSGSTTTESTPSESTTTPTETSTPTATRTPRGGETETPTGSDDASASAGGGWDDGHGDWGGWDDGEESDERRHRDDHDDRDADRKWEWTWDWGWHADGDDRDRRGHRRKDGW